MMRRLLASYLMMVVVGCSALTTWAGDIDELRERAQALRREAAERAERGQEDEAARLKQESRELMEKAEALARQGGKRGPGEGLEKLPPHLRPQAEKLEMASRRLQHLRVAAQNLKMAEMHDLAHQLAERAEGMERELQEAKERFMAEMHREQQGERKKEAERKKEGEQSKKQPPEREAEIQRDLRAEIKRLQNEVQELRAKLEKR